FQMGGAVYASPMAYEVNGKEYIVIAAGSLLFAFWLPLASGSACGGARRASRLSVLNGVQPTISGSEQLLRILTVGGIAALADAQRHQCFAADGLCHTGCQVFQAPHHASRVLVSQARRDHHEFVASHSRRVVVLAT